MYFVSGANWYALSGTCNGVQVNQGGTGLTASVSGGIPSATATTSITWAAAGVAGAMVAWGGAGAVPTSPLSLKVASQNSGSENWTFLNSTVSTGVTGFLIVDGAGQSTNPQLHGRTTAGGSDTWAINGAGTITQSNQKSCATGLTTDASGNINGCVASDIRLKRLFESKTLALPVIAKLTFTDYRWRDTKTRDAALHYGFVAQRVRAVFPTAVVTAGLNSDGTLLYGVDAVAMTALLAKGEQELFERESIQQKEIEELKSEIIELREILRKK